MVVEERRRYLYDHVCSKDTFREAPKTQRCRESVIICIVATGQKLQYYMFTHTYRDQILNVVDKTCMHTKQLIKYMIKSSGNIAMDSITKT